MFSSSMSASLSNLIQASVLFGLCSHPTNSTGDFASLESILTLHLVVHYSVLTFKQCSIGNFFRWPVSEKFRPLLQILYCCYYYNLLKEVYLRLRKLEVKRSTIVKFRMNNMEVAMGLLNVNFATSSCINDFRLATYEFYVTCKSISKLQKSSP